jgi:acetylglutamate kinase
VKVVLKMGGSALDDPALVRDFARATASLANDGHRLAVVHGGGAALTRTLGELGCASTFVDGLRVTDAKTRDVAVMVLAGRLNKELVAAIGAAGCPALGVCGGDLGLLRAQKKRGPHDLGFVGEVCAVDWRWIDTLWSHGAIPVIASIALGLDGEYYNVNADEVASACAVACNADALVYLTDVPGVNGEDGAVIGRLETERVAAMVRQSTVSGGMLPKLAACTHALHRGVGRVRIMPAARVGALRAFLAGAAGYGTEVVA